MTAERIIDGELALVPYYPAPETALAWYLDPELCRQVDNRPEPYTPERLERMYDWLNERGRLWYIRYRGELVGDAALRDDGEVCIVVRRESENMHIGRRVIRELLAAAREAGMAEVRAVIYGFNAQSRRAFEAAGFEHAGGENYVFRFGGDT